jgi:uncharacterized protein YcbX
VKLTSPKPCKRCILTTVNPDVGSVSDAKEPYKAIYRKEIERGMFGIMLIHETEALGMLLLKYFFHFFSILF